jgi:hypothetical protein
MGDIIGGVIGGVGSLIGGSKAKSADLTGFNYLQGSPIGKTYLPAGAQALNTESALLGGGTPEAQAQAKSAFQNYLGSTGYNFQLDQGTRAITGSAAARGILNSGSTAKALEQYGQNLASTNFNNYLGQQQGIAQMGLQAGSQIGAAGTQGGVAAGGQVQSGITSAGGMFGGAASAAYNNYFGGIPPGPGGAAGNMGNWIGG